MAGLPTIAWFMETTVPSSKILNRLGLLQESSAIVAELPDEESHKYILLVKTDNNRFFTLFPFQVIPEYNISVRRIGFVSFDVIAVYRNQLWI